MNVLCWWFGHKPGKFKENCIPCIRCGQYDIGYEGLVEDSRYTRVKEWLNYYLFRKWLPEKCPDCGRRYGKANCDICDDLPF